MHNNTRAVLDATPRNGIAIKSSSHPNRDRRRRVAVLERVHHGSLAILTHRHDGV
jgi:hypothetical protein